MTRDHQMDEGPYILAAHHKEADIYLNDADYSKYIGDNIFKGNPLGQKAGKIIIKAKSKKGKQTDFPMSSFTLPVISGKLKNILEENENVGNLEFLPLTIRNLDNQTNEYWGLNILNNIKCFDWENSKYEKFPPELFPELTDRPSKIFQLKIKADAINSRNIFRMYEAPVEIFVSSKLRTAIEKANLSGIEFRSLDQYKKTP